MSDILTWREGEPEPPIPQYSRQLTTLEMVKQGIDPLTGQPFEDHDPAPANELHWLLHAMSGRNRWMKGESI